MHDRQGHRLEQYFWKSVWQICREVKKPIPIEPAINLLGI